MKIKEKLYFLPLSFESLDKVNQSTEFRIQKVVNLVETSIHISPAKTGSIVARNNSIRVDHGNNIKIEGIKQLMSK